VQKRSFPRKKMGLIPSVWFRPKKHDEFGGVGAGICANLAVARERIGQPNRHNPWAYFYLAACLAHLGQLDEAARR
jgi:hypothetical protein